MKHLLYITILAAALFYSCNTKPGARAKVQTSRIDTSAVSMAPGQNLGTAYNPSATPAPGEEYYNQAMQAYEAGNKQQSFDLCLKSAGLGFPPAQFNVAIFYYNGEGVTKNLAKTVDWLQKAADQDYLQAQKQLALCHAQGIGTKRDPKQAAHWYERAATLGDADAQYKTGTAYYQGNGVLPDYDQAVKWYEKAAAQGVTEAMNDLALCYENGLGVSRVSPHKALELYKKAADLGNKIAKSNYDRLKKSMDESEIIFDK